MVHDSAGPTLVMLWDYDHRADPKIWEGADIHVGEDDPLALIDHVGKLLAGNLTWSYAKL